MRISSLLLALPLTFQFAHADQVANAEPSSQETIEQKILAQGVPAGAYKLLVDYMKEHHDREYVTDVYGCPSYLKVETKEMIPAPVPKPVAKDAKAGDKKEAPKTAAAPATPARDPAPAIADKDAKAGDTKTADASKDSKDEKKDAPKMIEHIKVTYKEIPPTGPTLKPCDEDKRVKFTKTVKFSSPTNVAIIDFSLPSTARRFFLINLQTGKVDRFYTAHGKGSGNKTAYATKFSNTPDSLQTSLGFYLTGDVYQGSYGDTLRLYGLDRSNDNAYNRDIVMHGAWYVGEDFIKSINDQTKKPYGRLGVSWGCPAVSLSLAPKIISILKGGSVLLHYHPDLMEKALSGREVSVPESVVVAPEVKAPEHAETSSEAKGPAAADPQGAAPAASTQKPAPVAAPKTSTNSAQQLPVAPVAPTVDAPI